MPLGNGFRRGRDPMTGLRSSADCSSRKGSCWGILFRDEWSHDRPGPARATALTEDAVDATLLI